MQWVAALVLGYLLGTFPTADLATRLASRGSSRARIDLRTAGSGNPGAANAAQVLGTKWGLLVLAGDVAKAVLACVVGRRLAGPSAACWAGTSAVVGHCLPVWTGFRGGKGVACSAGQCGATFPAYAPIDLFVAYATAKWKRQAFAATAVAGLAWIGFATLWWAASWPNLWGPRHVGALPMSAIASTAVILAKFESARRAARRPVGVRLA